MEEVYFSQAEAARILGITRSAIADAMDRGRIVHTVIGGRRLVTQENLEKYRNDRIQRALKGMTPKCSECGRPYPRKRGPEFTGGGAYPSKW